jgi:RecT family
MTEQSLALRDNVRAMPAPQAPALPSTTEWQTIVQMAGMLVPTGFLPSTIKTAEQAVLIILKGRELSIPPLYALSNIVVVQGKPTCSAELMLALIYRDHGDLALIVEESTPQVCRVAYRRRAWDRSRAFAFTLEDAQRADLAGKGTWKQYPQAMLRARAISAVARLAFPDSIAGMYLPEELGQPVRVTEDGAVEIDPSPVTAAVMESVTPPVRNTVTTAVEPVTERTRLLCAGFVEAVTAANPKVKPRLPPDEAGNAAWLQWLETKSAEWKQSQHNPANKPTAEAAAS